VRRPLDIDISDLAKTQIRAAEDWWRLNRTKAPNAIREELERAASIIHGWVARGDHLVVADLPREAPSSLSEKQLPTGAVYPDAAELNNFHRYFIDFRL